MYSTCRFKALTTLASAIALAGIPASLAFRDSNREVAIVDPALAKLGIQDARELSAVDALPGADLRWDFPRLDAAQLEIGQSLTFLLPGFRTIEIPLVDRMLIARDAVSFTFADPTIGASAEIVVHAGLVSGTIRAQLATGFEAWELTTGTDRFGIGGDWYTPAIDNVMIDPPVAMEGNQLGEPESEGGIADAGCEDTGAFIDVLVAYTPGFFAGFSSLEAMKTLVLADIARANAGLTNSNAIPRFRIAGYYACLQNSTGDVTSDLTRLQAPTDGWNDGVHAARNDARADLVMLFDPPSVAGGGTAFQGIAGGSATGFSVNAAPNSFIAARLLGLNMGACFESSSPAACPGYFPYAHGFIFRPLGVAVDYGTIMVNAAVVTQPIFSNIYVDWMDTATGSDLANNARTLSLTANNVANYRCSNGPDADCDNDGILDADAIAAGLVPDCNRTGLPDSCDIAIGISIDLNNDGVPDECPLTDTEFGLTGVVQLDTFGTSVSLSAKAADPTILLGIGAPGDDTGASNAGEAFVVDATAGILDASSAATLRPHDPITNSYFGRSISVFKRPSSLLPAYPARNLALVGAFRWPQSTTSGNYPSKGAVYLFEEKPDGTWGAVMQPNTTGPATPWRFSPAGSGGYGTQSYALFGYAAEIGHAAVENSDIIVVGTPGHDEAKGAVFIVRNPSLNVSTSVRRDQPIVSRRDVLVGAQAGDNYGAAIALEDNLQTSGASRVVFVAGAPGTADGRGAAYIRERVASTNGFGTTWPTSFGYNFPINNPVGAGAPLAAGDRYGTSVAISQRLVVVGAPGTGGGKGRVHFWERNDLFGTSGRWNYRGFFTLDDPMVEQFGSSVSIAPSMVANEFTVIVGAAKADVQVGSTLKVDAGAVFVLKKVFGTSGATLVERRTSNAPVSGDEFGYSTTALQGFSLIGAPFKDSGGLNAGAAKLLTTP
jgi:hypothetical protein